MTEPLEFRFPPDPEHLRILRQHVRSKLEGLAIEEDTVNNVVLVVDEMVANAIEHADPYRGSGHLLVRLRASGSDVLLDFEDPDVPADVIEELNTLLAAGAEKRPSPESERGRGLFLMATNIDRLEIVSRPDGGMLLKGRFVDAIG